MLTDTEVEHIAKLARIKITDSERETFKGELSSILDYVAKLNEVNTDNVQPLRQITGLSNMTRADEPKEEAGNKELLVSQAPSKENNFVKVKSVFDRK